ncbi:hypothetical protein HPB50_006356 [Hyalomma asiaticum]|uniref:Uncharacterized protein n=1 Tax=Hyalomma asiaticum TaxID=266040 RepID=A0ACB7S169_HYAAI|nr:hypothetical protein HPB50_006356 [Hyalomma asiaticum]
MASTQHLRRSFPWRCSIETLHLRMREDGYTVPAGTTCMINIHSLHRNKEQFDDPESYIPERFLPENSKNMHPFSFIPFSSGVRVCLE